MGAAGVKAGLGGEPRSSSRALPVLGAGLCAAEQGQTPLELFTAGTRSPGENHG